MTNRWLTLLEAHVEKALLGLAGLFMLGMLYMYLVRSPNVVEYQREKLGPRKLLEAIKQDADELDRKVRSATAEESNPEDFSRQLEKLHAEGIFAKTAEGEPVLRPELRLAATFGQPIVVPGLKDSEEAVGSIALVTPLKPSQPRARTGRSLVLREQIQIAGLEAPPSTATPEEESPEPEEAAWVTVAAYFNKKAQYNEMIKSGYAPYRAKAYVVGADVQRQEMLSNGEFSDWQAVRATKAMPKFDVREPVFDDATGELMNKDDIRQGFDTVKASQATLMQPPFYVVEGGDFWEVPPLVGYEDDEELEEEEGREEEEQRFAGGGRTTRVAPPRVAGPPAGRMPGGGGPGVAPPRGGGGRIGGPRGGGGGGATPRAGGYPGAGVRSDAAERREAR